MFVVCCPCVVCVVCLCGNVFVCYLFDCALCAARCLLFVVRGFVVC